MASVIQKSKRHAKAGRWSSSTVPITCKLHLAMALISMRKWHAVLNLLHLSSAP